MQKLREYSGTANDRSDAALYGRASHSAEPKIQDGPACEGNLIRRVGGWIAYLFSWYAY